LIINVEDPEVTESEDEAEADEGGEQQKVEVIDLVDENDDNDEAQFAGGVQPTAIEQPVQVQQLESEEQDAAIQQPGIGEQHVYDLTQVTAGEESPSKRVKLTK